MPFRNTIKAPGAYLINADCLDVLPTLSSNSVDMIFTDPPYGYNNNNGDLIANREMALGRGNPGPPRPIINDGSEANDIFRAFIKQAARILRPGGCCCCCCGGGGGPDPQFARWSLWIDEVLCFKQMVVWDKGPMGMGWHYRRSYETVLVAQKGNSCNWYDTTNRIENIIRPGDYGIRKIIPSANEHPTAKPVALAKHFIKLHTKSGDTVLDPFMGEGTTGIACERLDREFVGIEIDKSYFHAAARRDWRTRDHSRPVAPPAEFCRIGKIV
jgi:DNA modification methylase